MVRYSFGCLFVALCAAVVCADEPKHLMRPITKAQSVLAVYQEDIGEVDGTGTPSIILAAWPDGHIVWSADRLRGGAPYRAGHVDPRKVAALLARFEKDGLFDDDKLNRAHFGPDSEFINVFIKSGRKRVKMQSWHELFEASDEHVVTHAGAEVLDGRRRLDVLRKEPADYLFFRFVWSETRSKLAELIPAENKPSAGKPFMKAGVLAWKEPVQQPAKAQETKPASWRPSCNQPPRQQEEPSPSNGPNNKPATDLRLVFVRRMSRIQEGMPEKEILAILGKPDDVRTEYDPGGIGTARTKEIWCYGTSGHLTFPTLGCVYIDRNAKAQYVFGGQGNPPKPGMFEEASLRELLGLIDRAPELQGHTFDPLPIIQIVNTLQPLGKEMALAAIREYLRVASEEDSGAREGLFVVLRVLFEIPADTGYMPKMYVGEPWPAEPKAGPKAVPRFPVALVEDIPLLLISGYELSGQARPVEQHVDYFSKHGRLRARPLRPTHKPLVAYDRFLNSYLWLYGQDPAWQRDGKLMVINQLLRLVDSVYRRDADWYGYRFNARKDLDERWKQVVNELSKREVRWDEKKNLYTYVDGSTLPLLPKKLYRRAIWKLDEFENEANLIFERLDERRVLVLLEWSGRKKGKAEQMDLRVYAVKNKKKTLSEFKISSKEASEANSSHSWSGYAELQDGDAIQGELSYGTTVKVSPVYRP